VGSQHYLLGLLQEEDSMAAKALIGLGVSRDVVEAELAGFPNLWAAVSRTVEDLTRRSGKRPEAGPPDAPL